MKKTKINQTIEYLSPALIISFLFIHNIYLVMIGISFSLYILNLNTINKLIRSINKNLFSGKPTKKIYKNVDIKKSCSIDKEPKKNEKRLTLVEEIEVLGFIPSIKEDNNSNVA